MFSYKILPWIQKDYNDYFLIHSSQFFFKPKQFTEAIPSMKKAHNEDMQRLGEITNSLEEIKFKLIKLKKGLGKKKMESLREAPEKTDAQ